MLKLGLVGVVAVSLAAGAGLKGGCRDLTRSLLHLTYGHYRDMRHTVLLMPQKVVTRAPDTLSVPITGADVLKPGTFELDRVAATASLHNPVALDDSALARGERIFTEICTPCHGQSMAGDGPVAASFLPPPDLLGATTRGRSDGYIYSYIRFGGAVMPKYGQTVTATEAWYLVHYLRQRQKANPR